MTSKIFAVGAAIFIGWLGFGALFFEAVLLLDRSPPFLNWFIALVAGTHYLLIPIFMGAVMGTIRGSAFLQKTERNALGYSAIFGCLIPVFIGVAIHLQFRTTEAIFAGLSAFFWSFPFWWLWLELMGWGARFGADWRERDLSGELTGQWSRGAMERDMDARQKSDEEIHALVLEAIEQSERELHTSFAAQIWSVENAASHPFIADSVSCQNSEKPVCFAVWDAKNWTLITTRRVWSRDDDRLDFLWAREIDEIFPRNIEGENEQPCERVKIVGYSGKMLFCPTATGKNGETLVAAIFRLAQVVRC